MTCMFGGRRHTQTVRRQRGTGSTTHSVSLATSSISAAAGRSGTYSDATRSRQARRDGSRLTTSMALPRPTRSSWSRLDRIMLGHSSAEVACYEAAVEVINGAETAYKWARFSGRDPSLERAYAVTV